MEVHKPYHGCWGAGGAFRSLCVSPLGLVSESQEELAGVCILQAYFLLLLFISCNGSSGLLLGGQVCKLQAFLKTECFIPFYFTHPDTQHYAILCVLVLCSFWICLHFMQTAWDCCNMHVPSFTFSVEPFQSLFTSLDAQRRRT